MTRFCYSLARTLCRFVHIQCVRGVVSGRERLDAPGGYVLAVTHLSHVEPMLMTCYARRQIHWMARREFFARWWMRSVLRAVGTFSVNRTGVPVAAVRHAIALAAAGKIVGIFPEGGVAQGMDAVFRGGKIKGGACLIAQRAGVPIIPVVVLGTDRLNRVQPWLPFGRARVYVAVGPPILPTLEGHRRSARKAMQVALCEAFQATYKGLLATAKLNETDIP